MHSKLFLYLFAAVIILHQPVFAQEDTTIKSKSKTSSKANLKDTLDGKFDFSSFLIDAKGFIPVPFIITEPAVGGLGLAVVPIFLTPKKKPAGYTGYIAPDITQALPCTQSIIAGWLEECGSAAFRQKD
jgi:hypothetical protein